MKRMGQWVPKGLAGLLALAAGVVQAGVPGGGIVGYAPGSVAVPTLSEWTLIGLGLLLMVVAYRVLRTRANGRLLANLLVLGGAAAAG
ncbi:MAG TPA: midcut-by-XrtH protein, partial [Ottowia sp.]|nr:midcut-by-XrtH protein [Ottowia sp.]